MAATSSIKLLCSNGKPADLLITFDAAKLPAPVDELRVYFSQQPDEPHLVATYINGVQIPGNQYPLQYNHVSNSAELLIPVVVNPSNDDVVKARHYTMFTYKENNRNIVASTRLDNEKLWNKSYKCGILPDILPDKQDFNEHESLIIGLSVAMGSLLLMLAMLASCCLLKRHRKKKAQQSASDEYYETNFGSHKSYDEFEIKPPAKKPARQVSATTKYLQGYYSKLAAVKESDRHIDEDGQVEHFSDESII